MVTYSNNYIDFKSILNSKDKVILIVGGRGQGKTQDLLAQIKKITKER